MHILNCRGSIRPLFFILSCVHAQKSVMVQINWKEYFAFTALNVHPTFCLFSNRNRNQIVVSYELCFKSADQLHN